MLTHGTSHLSMNDFADKLRLTGPGETFVYATGDLGYSARDTAAELKSVRSAVWDASARGEVFLTQRRLPKVALTDGATKMQGACFEYRATKPRNGGD
jgi:hypothetical protein